MSLFRDRRYDRIMNKRRDKLNGNDYFGPPGRKKRRTEEKIAGQLSNFHLSPMLTDQAESSQWFFMQKPGKGTETFREIEDRLATSDSDSESESKHQKKKSSNNVGNEEGTLEIRCDDLQKLIDREKKEYSPLLRTPQDYLPVVLWQPPGDFIKTLVPPKSENSAAESADRTYQSSLSIQTVDSDASHTENPLCDRSGAQIFGQSQPVVSFPDDVTNLGKRQRRPTEEEEMSIGFSSNLAENISEKSIMSPIIREISASSDLGDSMEIE